MKEKSLTGKLLLSLSLLALVAGCTKEQPYQYELKEDVLERASLDTKGEYLYSASMMNASMSSADALPFSFSDNKRVRLEWTKDALRVIQSERDARYSSNKANDKLVLEIPVEYVDYECAKDRYGECTNSEKAKDDVTWDQKGKFKFKLEAAKSGELELLPILIEKTLGSNCYSEVSSKVVGIKLESDALNMQIERTFQTNVDCLTSNNLSDATVSATFHYSLVKIGSVLSQGFKTINYPDKDQNTFGFFQTERDVLDTDNNAIEAGKQVIMNHWSPSRSNIDYYLSPEFSKRENAVIRDLTYKTVDRINEGLAKSGTQFRITLHDSSDKVPGDIRNSMIVLVEDPVASSVIGYGPQTEDPVTGEIISARTIMFLGTIKKFLKTEYDEVIREKKRLAAQLQEPSVSSTTTTTSSTLPSADDDNGGLDIVNKIAGSEHRVNLKSLAEKSKQASSTRKSNGKLTEFQSDRLKAEVRNYRKNTNEREMSAEDALMESVFSVRDGAQASNNASNLTVQRIRNQYRYLQQYKNCSLGMGFDSALGSLSPRILDAFPDDAKPWVQLSESEKEKVIDILLPEVWVPTLIHELGHNLGLRHNFQGSEDKANFYSDEELKAAGLDHQMPFNSVMEYGDDFKALHILGKYDIAALRYGYQRQVEAADGSLVSVTSSLEEMGTAKQLPELKEYGYCTDENTGVNAGCRRFDLGTTYLEITQNEIKNYLENYKARNFRNGRLEMSLFDDIAAGRSRYNFFMSLRTMQEVYERINHDLKARYGLEEDAPEWESISWLKDIKDASALTARFFMSVIATPDLSCAIARVDKPNQVSIVQPLDTIDPNEISCFNLELDPKRYVMVGQFGKSLNSRKDPRSKNAYADQIDLRGYWIDKLMATRALFNRQLSSFTFDKSDDNYADRPDLRQEIAGFSGAVMMNELSDTVDLELANGKVVGLKGVPVDLYGTSLIKKPIHPVVARALGIANRPAYMNEYVAGTIVSQMASGLEHAVSGRPLAEAFTLRATSTTDNTVRTEGAKTLTVGSTLLVATPANVVAFQALSMRDVVLQLSKIDPDKLEAIITAREKDPKAVAPEDATADEKAAWVMDLETLTAFATNSLQSADFYRDLVYKILPW